MKEFIQGIHPDVFSAAIQILSVVCGLMFVLSLRARRSLKLLRSTPLVKIGAAPGNGLVAVSGRVEAIKGGGVVAPLTGAPCLWYRCRVDRFAPDPSHKTDSSSSWRYIGAHSSGMPFVLSDGSAACVVVPDVAEITPHDESLWYGGRPVPEEKNPPKLAPYTSGSAPGYVNNFDRSYRYKEERLYAGKEVFVIGTMTEEVVSTASAEMLEEDSEDLAENQGLEQTGAAGAETEVDEDISLEEADLLELERLLEPEEDVEGALRTANATTRRRLKDCRVISGVPREQLLSMSRLGGRVVFGAMIALLCVIGILLGFRLLA